MFQRKPLVQSDKETDTVTEVADKQSRAQPRDWDTQQVLQTTHRPE